MRIEDGIKLDFKDVLIIPKRSRMPSRANVDLTKTYKFRNSGVQLTCVPIISANMDTTGSFKMAIALAKHNMLTALHKHYSLDELSDFFAKNRNIWNNVFYTVGANDKDFDKLAEFCKKLDFLTCNRYPPLLSLDAANGYTEVFVSYVVKLRKLYPEAVIMAGNVVTSEMTEQLILSGADICKIGLGSGSACLTRVMSGVGYPQLSAVISTADAAHGIGGHVCSDGGHTCVGDIVKSLGAGADFIMIGNMLSGTDECDGEWVYDIIPPEFTHPTPVKKFLKFHGMSSKEAMELHNGGMASYRAAEGKEVLVPYKGSVDDVVQQITGGIRSACTYVGASKLKDLSKCTTFIRTTVQENKVFG